MHTQRNMTVAHNYTVYRTLCHASVVIDAYAYNVPTALPLLAIALHLSHLVTSLVQTSQLSTGHSEGKDSGIQSEDNPING